MENASKALIIAGAILLSILIIALGMNIYNSASSATGNADMSAQEIDSHNQTFTAYEGRIKGTQVRTLLNMIAKNNEEYEDRIITVSIDKPSLSSDASADIRGVLSSVKTNTTYNVTFTNGGADGIIDTCDIVVYTGSGSGSGGGSTGS